MVIDYSQTTNRFTQLDAYPLPNINDMVQKIAQYSVFITTDLRSAYHLIPLKFIETETKKLLADGIIEPSISPWRAQVLVTTDECHKKRMVIDYSQTINRFTQLDAYPLPNINDMVQKIAQYSVFITIDLQSAYHQIPLKFIETETKKLLADGIIEPSISPWRA